MPIDPSERVLVFSLVSNPHQAASMIVNPNRAFASWDGIIGDYIGATAMIDRLIQHADVLSLEGDSYPRPDLDTRTGTPPPGSRY